ncbi:hypothetical protein HRG_013996 [Hirsutella rhossiliensis]
MPTFSITRPANVDMDRTSREQAMAARLHVIERTSALARRELARAEAAQDRADRLALTREPINGRTLLHESEDTQHVNKVWARKESFRMKAYAEDAKMHDGVKYGRKSTGPFTGKFVSAGTIVHIDGEDYVEYRVLTTSLTSPLPPMTDSATFRWELVSVGLADPLPLFHGRRRSRRRLDSPRPILFSHRCLAWWP